MSTIEISKIKIGPRIRKGHGDLTNLVNSIKEIGLLHPIVIDENNNLIAGYRRMSAFSYLSRTDNKKSWEKIPCTILKIADAIRGELHENTVRQDFTISEVASIIEEVKETRIGHREAESEKDGNLPSFPKGVTREIVSNLTNISPRQIDKIQTIVKKAKTNKKFAKYLDDIDNKKKSVNTVHTIVTRSERNLPKIPLPKDKADVIYCDVPVGFRDTGITTAAETRYPTMTPQELMKDFATIKTPENAICFFWMSPTIAYDTIPLKYKTKTCSMTIQVPIYKAILDAGGFTQVKTEYAWNKINPTIGSYCQPQHENLFVAIKGKFPVPLKLFRSIIEEKKGKHSEKPNDLVQGMIEEMYPKRNYCQLYGRNLRKGWITHGNEI